MKGIQIKINGQWIYLPEDFSISLEQTSPVFNEQGTFSFPFEIPLEPNRSVFKNIADPFGNIKLKDIDRMAAELWFDGVLLYTGIVKTDEEVEFEDSMPLTFLSGQSDFADLIEGMSATDVPLDREIKLGYVVNKATWKYLGVGTLRTAYLPDFVMMNYTEYNVKDPYPVKEYCNVRLCTSDENGKYKLLDAKRPYSGTCFYVMYFLNCLLKHLNITIDEDNLGTMEDLYRLAFFTTQCHTIASEEERTISLSEIRQKDFCGDIFTLTAIDIDRYGEHTVNSEDFTYYAKDVFATNKNFPQQDVSKIIDDLKSAFGIRIIYDGRKNAVRMLYIKDILTDHTVIELHAEILDASIIKYKKGNIRLTYGNEDDVSFNYDEYSDVKTVDSYNSLAWKGYSSYDKTCYVDTSTGNAYRVKVNKSTGRDPVLFEVGGFRDYIQAGDSSLDDEEITIGFAPVIVNMVSAQKNEDGSTSVNRPTNDRNPVRPRSTTSTTETSEVLAVFADVELLADTVFDQDFATVPASESSREVFMGTHLKALCQEMYDTESNNEPPLRTYDAGYTMGIMRGPGSDSGLETVDENYDGEGNSSWTQTVGSYAFTSDSCDYYGRFFDYNGTEEGGADQTGRFSLKLIAGKDGYPIDSQYADRGLVSKFLSEYLYFMANKKSIVLPVRMNITQIVGIDLLKRYKIGDFVGFINKVSYTLDVNGVKDATIELYTL